MRQEDLAFYGAFAPKLQEIHDLMLHEIQAILDSISTDSEKAPAEHLKCRIKRRLPPDCNTSPTWWAPAW